MGRKAKKFAAEVEDYEDEEPLREPNVVDMADAMAVPVADNALAIPMFADSDGRTVRSISQLRLYKQEPGGPPAYKGTIPTSSTLETIGQMYGNGTYIIEGLNHRHTVLATKENIRIALDLPDKNEPGAAHRSDVDRVERLARASALESHENNKAFVQLIQAVTTQSLEKDRAWYAAQLQANREATQQQMQSQKETHSQQLATTQQLFTQTLALIVASNSGRSKNDDDGRKLVDVLLQGMKIAGELRSDSEPSDQPVWADIMKSGFGALSSVAQSAGGAALLSPSPTQPTQIREVTPRQRKLVRKAKRAMNFYDQVRAKGIDPDELLERLSLLESTVASVASAPDADTARAETPAPEEESDDDDDEDDILDDDEDEDDEEIAAGDNDDAAQST